MNYNAIRLKQEQLLAKEVYESIQGDIVGHIYTEADYRDAENHYKKHFDGYSYPINDKLFPQLSALCRDVIDVLECEERIDFFVVNDDNHNAFVIPDTTGEQSHIICLTSKLIDAMNNEELKFTIGHEIGHLLTGSAKLNELLSFVYGKRNKYNTLYHKIMFWKKLAELNADRFGFLSSGSFGSVVNSFFKMSSGLSLDKVEFDYDSYLEHNNTLLDSFTNDGYLNRISHPINPLRIKAIELFSKSKSASAFLEKKELVNEDKELDDNISELLSNQYTMLNSELDSHRLHFIASAGLIMANIDGSVDAKEIDFILKSLSGYAIFPSQFFKVLYESGKVVEFFNKSVQEILRSNPAERESMLNYMIHIAFSDNEIKKEEVGLIVNFGIEIGYQRKEIYNKLASYVIEVLVPKLII